VKRLQVLICDLRQVYKIRQYGNMSFANLTLPHDRISLSNIESGIMLFWQNKLRLEGTRRNKKTSECRQSAFLALTTSFQEHLQSNIHVKTAVKWCRLSTKCEHSDLRAQSISSLPTDCN